MLFFIMYDIENDKVRYNIVKYLERMGCHRIQKSIFLANLSMEKYDSIRSNLVEVQSLYDNHRSFSVTCLRLISSWRYGNSFLNTLYCLSTGSSLTRAHVNISKKSNVLTHGGLTN